MERSDGAKRPARASGLAPVTYLPGAQPQQPSPVSVAPSEPPFVSRDLTADRAIGAVELPTLAGVFGQLDAQIEAQLAERHAADDSESSRAEARAAQKAERISMNALTRRGMSKREVERSLRARELDDDTVAAELDRLEGVGLIDDLALAQNLVGILQERKGLGRSAIAAELTRRLLTPAAIEYALELVDTGDELGRAREIAVKRAAQLRSYDRETAVRRLSGFLLRRGYSGSTVRAAVEHALPFTPNAGSSVRFR